MLHEIVQEEIYSMLDTLFNQEKILERFEETIRNQTVEEAVAKAVAKATDSMRAIYVGNVISDLHDSGWDKDRIINFLLKNFGIDEYYAELKYTMHTPIFCIHNCNIMFC